MKGMLTGPVTILNWSFPRADVSRELQSKQLALALRDEVIDLEKAGISAIQVDEPAIREGVRIFPFFYPGICFVDDGIVFSCLSAALTGTPTSSGLLTPSSFPRLVLPTNSNLTLTSATQTLTTSSPLSSVLMLMSSPSKLPRPT